MVCDCTRLESAKKDKLKNNRQSNMNSEFPPQMSNLTQKGSMRTKLGNRLGSTAYELFKHTRIQDIKLC